MLPFGLREYLSRSSFHGLHYLVDDGLHWTERVFWLCCVLGSWWGSVYLMLSTLEFARNNPITLSIETDYLHWKTPFPAIIVCETDSYKVRNIVENSISAETISQVVFFEYYMSYNYIYNYTGDISYYKNLRSTCNELFNYCSWNNKEFECCDKFLPIETAFGICFGINSVLTNRSELDLFMNRNPGKLQLEFENPCVKVYAVSNDEIITEKLTPLVLQKDLNSYTEYNVYISVQQTISNPDVQEIDILHRKCRFPDENNLEVAKKYSYPACNLQCQKDAHLALYNCTHHYMPFVDPSDICDEPHLIHLAQNLDEWNLLAHDDCKCELSCDKNNILFIGRTLNSETRTIKLKKESTKNHITIHCEPPYDRIIRARSKVMLDNIVSLGGTAGLFVGASILSVIELIYYLTIRAIDSKLMRKRQQKQQQQQRRNKITVFPFVK